MVLAMRSRATFILATAVLAICFVCQVAEIFDQWDHTLQTGDDTEYTFVIVALCVGVVCSLDWFLPKIAGRDSEADSISFPRIQSCFPARVNQRPVFSLQESPPAAQLRI